MSVDSVSFYATSIVPPLFALALNIAVRCKRALDSAGADWILGLALFDFAALMNMASIQSHITNEDLVPHTHPIIGIFFAATLVLWIAVAIHFENYIAKTPVGSAQFMVRFISMVLMWCLVLFLTAAHIYLFVSK